MFLLNLIAPLLNPVPILGHYRALRCYIEGDIEGAHDAMFAATRSSSILVCAYFLGLFLGIAGMILGAGLGGLLMDAISSVINNEPQGIFVGIMSISEHFLRGILPISTIVHTSLLVFMDMAGGWVVAYLIHIYENTLIIREVRQRNWRLAMH